MKQFFAFINFYFSGRAVVADELIIASRGGAGGGGQSWVHPRLVSNFLNYACPEFAEEVNDIFTRFTTGDPALSAEAFENLKRVHAAELEAAHGDRLKEAAENVRFQALLKQHQDTNAALATEIAKLRLTEADLEKEVALANQAKIQAQEEAKMANEEAKIACEAKDKAEENIAVDSTRPGNIFAKMDSEDIPTSNRHSEPDLWFPARHITTDACIYFSRLNYRHFVNAVLVRKLPCEPHVSYAKSDFAKKLKSKNRKTRKAARKDIAARFKSLSTRKQLEIIDELVERTSDQFKDVFNCQLDIANCDLETATNNISMYATLCKSLKKGYGVDYSTEIETKYLAKMADNFNEFTGGACNMMLGQDYDQDFEDVDLIAC